MNCCDAYGKCTEGPDCPIRRTETLKQRVLAQLTQRSMRTEEIIFACAPARASHVRMALADLQQEQKISTARSGYSARWHLGGDPETTRSPTELEVFAGIPGFFTTSKGRVHWMDER